MVGFSPNFRGFLPCASYSLLCLAALGEKTRLFSSQINFFTSFLSSSQSGGVEGKGEGVDGLKYSCVKQSGTVM